MDDLVSCHELCDSNLCPKCHFNNIFGHDHHHQCTVCDQHVCNFYVHTDEYVNCLDCEIAICNNNLKDYTVDCENCEHQYCEYCRLHSVVHRCECGSYRRCTSCIGAEHRSSRVSGMYGTPDSKVNMIDLCSDGKIGDGNKHPWCDIDFAEDLVSEF
jgi:hypothetical protein